MAIFCVLSTICAKDGSLLSLLSLRAVCGGVLPVGRRIGGGGQMPTLGGD